jgi:hypothetical protein
MTTQTAHDIAALSKQVDDAILNGTALQAFETFYADDVIMQENSEEPRVGKAVNRAYEEQFFANVEAFHGAKVIASAAAGDSSFSEWWMDLTFKGGLRVQLAQVAVRTWKDGKIVAERFYHKGQ